MSEAESDGASKEGEPSLVAPTWHTVAVLLVFLALVAGSAITPNGKNSDAQIAVSIQNRELIYIAALVVEWAIFAFVYWGILQKTSLIVLMGKTWDDRADLIRQVALGIGAAFLVFCSTAILINFFGPFDRHVIDLDPKTAVQLYFFFLMLVSGGFTEEIIFRGYFLRQFKYFFKSATASIFLQAVLFSLAHGIGESLAGMFNKFLTGFIFGYIAYKSRSLMPTIIAHCCINGIAAILSVMY